MKPTLIVIFMFLCVITHAQSGHYHFNLSPDGFNLVDTAERDSVLQRLDGFLEHKHERADQNPFVDPDYAKKDINSFENLYYAEFGYGDGNFYKPTILALLPVIKNQEYVIKIAYIGVSADKQAKLKLIATLVAKKKKDNYYIYNAVDYNTRNWNKRQVGSIYYIFPNKLDVGKAREMDRISHELARKFATPIIPVTYYRCDDPEQLLKMMGYDYIPNMYLSMHAGFSAYWNYTLLAGNNSELYVHELVHFYTAKLFPHYTRIMNEGYATYLGGSGGLTLHQLKVLTKRYLDRHPGLDITKRYIDFGLIDGGYIFTYIVSGLICKDIESRYGFNKIAELFDASDNDQYFKALQNITDVSIQQFPTYVKRLVNAD